MQKLVEKVLTQIGSVVLGKPNEIKLALACLLAKGHILIEDLPGMGKTTLAQILATTLGLSYQRSQFTSDLLPSDVVGISIFNSSTQDFELKKGPIFNQVVLADEINRASPKTQSALLEAMEEHQVSIDGTTYELPTPFFVIATQNPLFHAGTYPLPESQLDRFMMRISLGFPDIEAEKKILASSDSRASQMALVECISIAQLIAMQDKVQEITTTERIIEYVIALCRVSRKENEKTNPLSPRAGKALLSAAKAWAFMENRDYVIPEDIQAVFSSVCQHRLGDISQTAEHNTSTMIASTKILQQVDPVSPLEQ